MEEELQKSDSSSESHNENEDDGEHETDVPVMVDQSGMDDFMDDWFGPDNNDPHFDHVESGGPYHNNP